VLRTSLRAGGLALALAACGPDTAKQTIAQPKQVTSEAIPSSAACGGPTPYLTAAACKEENIVALSDTLTALVEERGKALSRRGQQILLEGQSQWLAAMRTACELSPTDQALSFGQSACVQISLIDRTMALPLLVQVAGPHTIQLVEAYRALPPAVTAEDKISMVSAAFFPRIDDPDVYEAAFNAAAVRTLKADLPTDTEQTIVHKIVHADADIISVEYDTLYSTRGAAHPGRDVEALTFLLKKKRSLRADDLFDRKTPWKAKFATLASDKLKAATIQEGCDAPLALEDARDASLRADRWLVSQDGLHILYPPYALGPYAMEGCQIVMPWDELRPLLRKDAAVPVKPTERARKTLEG
jgi:hypothetical protein